MPREYGYETDSIPLTPVGSHGSNTSLGTAATLTRPAGANRLILQALAQNIRFTLDGTVPTATVGFQLPVGATVAMHVGDNASAVIKVIEETSGAKIAYQWAN